MGGLDQIRAAGWEFRCGSQRERFADLNLELSEKPPHILLHESHGGPMPVYRTLVPWMSFRGSQLDCIWQGEDNSCAVAIFPERRLLLVGLDVAGEILRYRQGDPAKAQRESDRSKYGFDYIERPNYLYEGQVLAEQPSIPWADRLGFLLARQLAILCGLPLIEPLPDGLRGLIVLTGDDDQAYLEKYAEQLRLIGKMPITYFLHPKTRHTSQTISTMPSSVEFGLHPDALEEPNDYQRLCSEQHAKLSQMTGRPLRLVRNHGFLNQGYLGHLAAWEAVGLRLDVNLPGVDGTVLNGSLLPMRVQRPDGSWSKHWSLLSLFGDGMLYALGLDEPRAVRRIEKVARQIEGENPGVIVFNFHPQNVADTRRLHRAVRRLAQRRGWAAWGLDSYLTWLEMCDSIQFRRNERGTVTLSAPVPMQHLALALYDRGRWHRIRVPGGAQHFEIRQ